MNATHALFAAAVGSLLLTGCADDGSLDNDDMGASTVRCAGINECAGTSECACCYCTSCSISKHSTKTTATATHVVHLGRNSHSPCRSVRNGLPGHPGIKLKVCRRYGHNYLYLPRYLSV